MGTQHQASSGHSQQAQLQPRTHCRYDGGSLVLSLSGHICLLLVGCLIPLISRLIRPAAALVVWCMLTMFTALAPATGMQRQQAGCCLLQGCASCSCFKSIQLAVSSKDKEVCIRGIYTRCWFDCPLVHSPQSACVRAPVLRVTKFGPQLTLLPLLVGFSALSPPGQ